MIAQVKVAYPYDKIYKTDKRIILMYSPRISGKSYALGQAVYVYAHKYPNHDIVVTRANYNALEDSLYNEIIDFAESIGDSTFYKAYNISTITRQEAMPRRRIIMKKFSEYNFKELVEQATKPSSTTKERMELWYWFEHYGSVYSWNGECYKIDKETDLYPIYEETVDEDGEIEYGDVIDCEVR